MWPKRIAYLLLWCLLIFGDDLVRLLPTRASANWVSYLIFLGERGTVLTIAIITILVDSQFRLIRAIGQIVYFILFVPIASLYVGYHIVKGSYRLPTTLRRLITLPSLHAILWPLTIISAYGILTDWQHQVMPFYLGVVILAIFTLVVLSFMFAFAPGVVHRLLATLALSIWKYNKKDVEDKLNSEEFSRDSVKREAKAKELLALVGSAERVVRFFQISGSRKTIIRMWVVFLSLLLILTTFLFALSFLALDRINPRSYEGLADHPFLGLYLYSLTNMFSAEPPGIVPANLAARTLAVLQVVCAVAIGLLLLLVVTTLSPERYEEELNQVTGELRIAEKQLHELVNRLQAKNP